MFLPHPVCIVTITLSTLQIVKLRHKVQRQQINARVQQSPIPGSIHNTHVFS